MEETGRRCAIFEFEFAIYDRSPPALTSMAAMPRTTSRLPEPLHYLQPFRKRFLRQPESLDETTGMPLLLELLSERINGLSENEAKRLLASDGAALSEWLALPAQVNDPLQFAGVLLASVTVPTLIRSLREEAAKRPEPFPWVKMDVPPGAKVQRFEESRDGGLLIKWKGLLIGVGNVPPDKVTEEEERLAVHDPRDKLSISAVQFGEVTGTKSTLLTETWRGAEKRIKYVLKVRGGHAMCDVDATGKSLDLANWDEKGIEDYFHSISITVKVPNPKA